MNYRKGQVIVFAAADKANEEIVKASNDPIHGEIITTGNTYSTDFINRWVRFGFCRVFTKKSMPAHLATKVK